MGNAKTIGLVSGRYIFHNPYREFVFFDKLKARGYKCRVFFIKSNVLSNMVGL